MMKRFLPLLLGLALSAPLIGDFTPPLTAKAADAPSEGTVQHSFAYEAQNIHAKYIQDQVPANITEEYRDTVATNYQQNTVPDLYDKNASYSRIVVDAPASGDYILDVSTYNANANLSLWVYVNSYGNKTSTSLSGAGWWVKEKLEYSPLTVTLEEGVNVIVLQWNHWGNLVTFALDDRLTLKDFGSTEEGVYNQADFAWNCVWVENPQETLWNPDLYPEFTYIKQDGSAEYEGAAELIFTPASDSYSLDLDIQVDVSAGLESSLAFAIDGGTRQTYVFQTPEIGTEATIHLPSWFLEDIGYEPGRENDLRITQTDGTQQIRVLGLSESTVVDARPGETTDHVISGDELKSSVLVKGRSLAIEEGIALDWSGSGIAFDITGGGDVRASFNALSNTMNTRFAVEIDGEFTGYAAPTENALIATGLSEETHRIELTKTSEANGGLTNLLSITVGEGTTIAPASEKDTKMLFLGGSIICGNQMDENGDEDQYQAFANLLAKAWDADYQVVAASGRGLIQGTLGESGWAADNTKQIGHIWTKTSYFRDSEAEYAVDSYVPDAIVLNVGNNDIGQCEKFGNTEGDVAAECAKFIEETLLVKYPNAKVIFAWGIGTTHSDTATAAFQSAIEGIESPNVSFVNFDPQIQGQGGHPSYYQHDYIASVISETLAEMTSEEDPYVRKYCWQSQEFEDATIKNSPNAKLHVYPETKGQNWSGNAYYGDLSNFSGTIDEILPDGSNVGHAEFTFTVDRDGLYNLQLGYATSATVDIAYNADGGDFLLAEGLGTNDWCGGHGHYANLPIVLTAGTHVIRVTAPIGDGWANYDYLNLLYVAESEVVAEADAWAESFMSTTGPLCEDVTLGSIASFPEETWTELADSYALLSDEAKNLLVGAPDYEDMRARYGQIQPKYGYEDFLKTPLGHEVEKAAFYAPMDANPFVEDMLWWILPAALVALALLGGSAYYIRKRRTR